MESLETTGSKSALDFPGLIELEQALGRARVTGSMLAARHKLGNEGDMRDILSHFHTTLWQRVGLPAQNSSTPLPVAPYRYLADSHHHPQHFVLALDPVHLRPEQDRLLLFPAERFGITQPEADSLVAAFNDHFADRNLKLIAPTPVHWYLINPPATDIHTIPPYEVEGRNINLAMPSGTDARFWNAVLNETQMLFYQAEVNQAREAEGKATINGVWPHSGGNIQHPPHTACDTLFTDEPVTVGLMMAAGGSALPIQQLAAPEKGYSLAVLDQLIAPALAQQPQQWLDTLTDVVKQIQPLIRWVGSGARKLTINPCDGRSFAIDSTSSLRFWRRRRRLDNLAK